MKKSLLFISTISVWSILSAHSETNSQPVPGSGLRPSMGGAPATSTTPQSGRPTLPESSSTSGTTEYGIPRNDTPTEQRMEAGPSSTIVGGAMGGATAGSDQGVDNLGTSVPPTQYALPQGTTTPPNGRLKNGTGFGSGMGGNPTPGTETTTP